MRVTPLLCLLGLVAACYQGHDGPAAPTTVAGDTLRILGGPLVLDSLAQAGFAIAGPRVLEVSAATFRSHDAQRQPLPATIGLRRFTGDSGVVLQATLVATGPVGAGEYDLVLSTPRSAASDSTYVVARALRVSRPWAPRGGTPVPNDSAAAPGPAGGPPPAPTPPPTPPPPTPPPAPITYGTLRVTVAVTGTDAPATFTVFTSGGSSYADDDVDRAFPGTSGEWRVSTGPYRLVLSSLPNNCVAGPPVNAIVVQDSLTLVTLGVTCTAPAFVRVNVTFAGDPPGGSFSVRCSLATCGPYSALQANGSITLMPVAALQSLLLDVPFNCTSNVVSPVAINPVAGTTIDLDVALTCGPTAGTLRILVRAPAGTGPYNVWVGYQGCFQMYDCADLVSVQANVTVDRRVPLGRYDAGLIGLPLNCASTGPNPAAIDVPGGGTALVAFDVTCN